MDYLIASHRFVMYIIGYLPIDSHSFIYLFTQSIIYYFFSSKKLYSLVLENFNNMDLLVMSIGRFNPWQTHLSHCKWHHRIIPRLFGLKTFCVPWWLRWKKIIFLPKWLWRIKIQTILALISKLPYITVSTLEKLTFPGSFQGKEFLDKLVHGGTVIYDIIIE